MLNTECGFRSECCLKSSKKTAIFEIEFFCSKKKSSSLIKLITFEFMLMI